MRTTPGTGEYIATYFFRVQKLTHNCELPVIAEKISKATGCGWQPGGLRRSGWRVIAERRRGKEGGADKGAVKARTRRRRRTFRHLLFHRREEQRGGVDKRGGHGKDAEVEAIGDPGKDNLRHSQRNRRGADERMDRGNNSNT